MGRKAEIGFYASRGGYFTTYKGERHRLRSCVKDDRPAGPDYLAALERFREVMQEADTPRVCDFTFASVADLYTDYLKRNSPETARTVGANLKRMSVAIGRLKASEIRPADVYNWIDSHHEWAGGMRALMLQQARAAFRHAVDRCGLTVNPLASAKLPRGYGYTYRGPEFCLEPELIRLLLDNASAPFRDFLTLLWRTGARPTEISHAESRNVRVDPVRIVHLADERIGYRHKNAKKKKHGERDRTIYLDAACVEIVKRNVNKGRWLLPTGKGNQYTTNAIRTAMNAVRRAGPVREWLEQHGRDPRTVIAYSFRHTFITNGIKRGVSIKTLADLCGTSVVMIERAYSHATADTSAMHQAYLACL